MKQFNLGSFSLKKKKKKENDDKTSWKLKYSDVDYYYSFS